MLRKLFTISLVLLLCSCSHSDNTNDAALYVTQVKSVQKLVLAQMTISKMATIDDIKLEDAQGMKQVASALLANIKIGNRKGAYSYDTYLRAYIDLSDFSEDDVEISDDGNTITIYLPDVQTEFAGRDVTIRELHYRVTGLRSNIRTDERAKIKEMMNQSLIDEVQNKSTFTDDLKANAKHNAETYFKALLGEDKNVIVNFKS